VPAYRAEAVPGDAEIMIDVAVNPGGSSKPPLTRNQQVQKLTMPGDKAPVSVILK
jgi:hypothetical protein